MKMHFLVSYLMVILWVCYGYPMVITANYPTILSTQYSVLCTLYSLLDK